MIDRVQNKEIILKKYGYKCVYCGASLTLETAHIDHVVPIHKGGTDDWKNLVSACHTCNLSKGAKFIFSEWMPPYTHVNYAVEDNSIDLAEREDEALSQYIAVEEKEMRRNGHIKPASHFLDTRRTL
jgi:hypothetical protein